MTSGLITLHWAHHYGAQLQALATMRAVEKLGHSCEIVNYRPPYSYEGRKLYTKWTSLWGTARNVSTTMHLASFRRRAARFEAFIRDQMRLSPKRYPSFEALAADPPAYDVYIAGSDQIWNPKLFADKRFEPAYLQTFVKEGRRISYAPSLGEAPFSPEEEGELRRAVEPYSALSVREESGRDKLEKATGRRATVVLDPTLLLGREEWGALAADPGYDRPYILCYFISDHSALDPYALELSRKTGWPIVQLGQRRRMKGAWKLVLDAGPAEFLGLFRHAAFVCTNSFHGTVFSLQFQKDFFTSVSPKERDTPQNSRVYSLLTRLGCTQRVVGMENTDGLDTPVDYSQVDRRLEAAREQSLDYLRAALEGPVADAAPAPQEEAPRRPVLASRQSCTGCSACQAVCPVGAITMVPDKEGFLRPQVGESCVYCRRCQQVCPPLSSLPLFQPRETLAAWAPEESVRMASSSGGIFSLLGSYVLDQGGVVFGAVLSEDCRRVYHAAARTLPELEAMRGSKYVQSDLGTTFRQAKALLDAGTPVLFSGTPCQIAGLRSFLGREYDNLLTCDLVCHGVPSPGVYEAYVRQLEEEAGAPVASLAFRDKGPGGWKKAHLTAVFRGETPPLSQPLYQTPFGRGFGMQLFLRPACGQCPYAQAQRPGDFTLGDFWGLDPKAKLPVDREKGVSLVLLNTPRAQAVFEDLRPSLGCAARPLEEAVAGNPSLSAPAPHSPRRSAFFSAFTVEPFDQVSRQFLTRPPLPYRAASRLLTPGMKGLIRKVLK